MAEVDFGEAVRLIIADYRRFLGTGASAEESGDSKAFAARHAAARAALTHLDHVRKLAGEADPQAAARLSDDIAAWRARMGVIPQEDQGDDDDASTG